MRALHPRTVSPGTPCTKVVIFRPGGMTGRDQAGRGPGEVNNLEGFPHSQAPIGHWAARACASPSPGWRSVQ